MTLPSKQALKEELMRLLAEDLTSRERAHRSAMEGATHEEARPENDKDTRALEQSYLARGQALRIEELREQLSNIEWMTLPRYGADDAIGIGALVTVEEAGVEQRFFIAPYGGGKTLGGALLVKVIVPNSPLGQALVGKRQGDDCDVRVGGGLRELSIVSVE